MTRLKGGLGEGTQREHHIKSVASLKNISGANGGFKNKLNTGRKFEADLESPTKGDE